MYNNEGEVKNIREFELRILHHNVQSLNNKLLDIKIMLTHCGRVTQISIFTVENFLLPTDAHNVKKHRVIKTF